MKIKDIYDKMKRIGVTQSQMQFSQIWLSRSDRYFSHLLATNREPGLATLGALRHRLVNVSETMRECPLKHILMNLSDELANHIAKRVITDIRRHRRPLKDLSSIRPTSSGK